MNEYIYIIRPTRLEMLVESTPEEDQIVGAHFQYLKRHCEQGLLLLAGRSLTEDARTLGICIFRAESDEDAEMFMRNDPAVIQGVMRAELMPYRVALLSDTYPRAGMATAP